MQRKIKQNIYGNWVGYLGTRRSQEFGTKEVAAGYWLLTGTVDFDECWSDEWLPKCKQAIVDSCRKQTSSTRPWRYDEPVNPFFRVAEPAKCGEDY
jgi:hypothetical protein